MKKMSDKQMFDYILYIKKYKPDIWLDLQGNKKVQKIMKKFESVDESFGLILRNLAKHAAKKAMYDKMKKNRKKGRRESISVDEDLSKQGFAELRGQAKYLQNTTKDLMRSISRQDEEGTVDAIDYIVSKSKLMKDILGDKRYNESVNESKSDVLQSLSEIKSLIYSLYQEMSKVQKHLDPKDAQKIKKLMSRPLGDLGKSTSYIKSLSRQMESVNEGVVDKVDELSDVIKKEIFSIGKKDKKMGLELAKLYKKYFIEFFVRVKKMTKDSSLIETKKRDSRGTLRDYKKEYKKYGSSTKSKKYRAELNKYNRQQGTYGNGDGKDASHKGGKIVGFESQSKNRGRAEKSRLKK